MKKNVQTEQGAKCASLIKRYMSDTQGEDVETETCFLLPPLCIPKTVTPLKLSGREVSSVEACSCETICPSHFPTLGCYRDGSHLADIHVIYPWEASLHRGHKQACLFVQ